MSVWRRIALFLSVMGPGIITANIDNDASGITTYSVAGARFGYALLWTLIPTTVALVVIQEMVARMGTVTGKGLSDLHKGTLRGKINLLHDDRPFHRKLRHNCRQLCRLGSEHGNIGVKQISYGASGELQGATISSATWTVPTGITKDSSNQNTVTINGVAYGINTVCTIWLSGGTDGTDYDLLCRIITSDSRTLDKTITIPVRSA